MHPLYVRTSREEKAWHNNVIQKTLDNLSRFNQQHASGCEISKPVGTTYGSLHCRPSASHTTLVVDLAAAFRILQPRETRIG